MGIDPKISFPVLGPFPMKKYFCGYGVAINMVFKSLNSGCYGGYTQYESIIKVRTGYYNVCGALVEFDMNSQYIVKDTRAGS